MSQRDTRGLSGARARWRGGGRWGTGRAVLAERCRPFAWLTRSSPSPPQSFLQSHFSPINILSQTQVRREPRGWEVSPGLQEQTHTVSHPTSTGDAEPGGEAARGLCRVHTAQGQTDSMLVVQNHVCRSTVRREQAGAHAAGGRGEHWLPRQLRGRGSQAPHARGGGASVSRGLCRAVRGVSRGPR